jgi:hypothetical protein
MGMLSVVAAIASYLLLGVTRGFVGMVFMDFTAALKHEGLVTQERWDRLIDEMGPALRQCFAFGSAIPVGLALMGVLQFIIAWLCRRPATMTT